MLRRLFSLTALSPLDGRYASQLSSLTSMSESGLIKYRIKIEVSWFIHLASLQILKDPSNTPIQISSQDKQKLHSLWENFSISDAEWVKQKEKETNHDLKAVEYFLKENSHLKAYNEFFHVCCTSEDINNLSYSLMFSEALSTALMPILENLFKKLQEFSVENSDIAMLGRTHGQPATPTTIGKEIANFAYRIHRQIQKLKSLKLQGKCNGAVGNFNAHIVTFPEVNWEKVSESFIESLGLEYNPFTTQIEPHDSLAEICGILIEINTVLLDLCRDMWSYISLGYFKGKVIASEVGSSTMPHKVNPIFFENAEGNLGLSNAILSHLQQKLPVSRFQRDLSDSTALRNMGSAFGYSLLSYKSILEGFRRVSVNEEKIREDLENHWEILAEPIQMILRRAGYPQPYELLKNYTRGRSSLSKLSYESLLEEISATFSISDEVKKELNQLSPSNYTGLAPILARSIKDYNENGYFFREVRTLLRKN